MTFFHKTSNFSYLFTFSNLKIMILFFSLTTFHLKPEKKLQSIFFAKNLNFSWNNFFLKINKSIFPQKIWLLSHNTPFFSVKNELNFFLIFFLKETFCGKCFAHFYNQRKMVSRLLRDRWWHHRVFVQFVCRRSCCSSAPLHLWPRPRDRPPLPSPSRRGWWLTVEWQNLLCGVELKVKSGKTDEANRRQQTDSFTCCWW